MAVMFRSVSRDFFSNADIAELSPLARLLFIATWLEADREGRLLWHPRTLKLRYLALDACNIDTVAEELVEGGFVVPYQVEGKECAFIPGFASFQAINNKERASQLPPPPTDATATRPRRDTDARVTRPRRDATPLTGMEWSGVVSNPPSQGGDGLPTTSTTECRQGGGASKISPPRKFLAGSKGGA